MGSKPLRILVWPLFAIIVGCASPVLTAINQQTLGAGWLCSAPLGFPDDTPDTDRRKPFEDKLTALGILRRIKRLHLAQGHYKDTFEIAPGYADSIRYLRVRTKALPAVVRICFGHFRALRVLDTTTIGYFRYVITFTYRVDLDPWAQSLYPYLHVQRTGVASTYFTLSDDTTHPVSVAGLKGIDQRFIMWPPNGAIWYPTGYPARLLWIHEWRV